MGDRPEALQPSEPLDLETIRSRIRELSDIHRSSNNLSDFSPLDSEKLLDDCVLHLDTRIKQILSEYSDFGSLGFEDLDAYLEHSKEELKLVEAENIKISNEIEVLNRAYVEDSTRLESDLEGLSYSLEFVESQGVDNLQMDAHVECSMSRENQRSLVKGHEGYDFEILELDHQIEKNKITLRSLQDIEHILKRVEAVEKIEDILTGLKVIEFEGNCIRLSLKTFVPTSDGLLCQQKMEDIIESSVLDHELLIEVMDGTMELKNVEIFPNDVYIGEIIDAAKSLRQFFSSLSIPEMRSSLEWFIRRVRDRIVICNLRRLLVKDANKSRHSFEYLDRDETITVHVVGGIDIFIKLSQGWPISKSALKLISLKNSNHHSKGISLSFLCKVEEMANSLDVQTRQNLSSFVDAIEEILVQQMRSELHSSHIPQQ